MSERADFVVCGAEVTALERHGGPWRVHAGSAVVEAPVVFNAAGAWADAIGVLAGARPLGLEPRRRSAFVFAPPPGLAIGDWPLTLGIAEDWYFKPDAGLLLASPANAEPVVPHDVQPEEMDIALAIHRIAAMTTLAIRRPIRTWAGLRSFVADGDLVGGEDPHVAGFYAAQGGYGIQTSAGMGEACAALVRRRPIPDRIVSFGATAASLAPARLGRASPDVMKPPH